MKDTKKLTLGAMSIALGVLFMAVGAYVEALDMTVAALNSLLMVFMFVEVGRPYTYFVWLGTSLLGFVFFAHSFVWVTYFLLFGIYPILKAYIEKLRRPFWIPIKLIAFNISAVLMILASEFILGIPFFEEDVSIPILEENTYIFKIALYVALIITMLVYDYFLTVMARFYLNRIRPKISKLLK
ncbi:MAG: hypothetical protein E7617_05520 [Ruminococcaceae bacterium]|nr:hypothetical protein [Oscillospiraceae bacterium]